MVERRGGGDHAGGRIDREQAAGIVDQRISERVVGGIDRRDGADHGARGQVLGDAGVAERNIVRRRAEAQRCHLRVVIRRTAAAELGVDMDRVILRVGDEPAGDQDVVDLLGVAPEHVAVALFLGQQRVEIGEHPALPRIGELGLRLLEIEAVPVAEHGDVERRIVGEMVLHPCLDPRRLRSARGVAGIGGGLVVAPQGLAAEARGEMDVDRGDRLAGKGELGDQRLARAVIGRAFDQLGAALDIIDAIDIVEIAVADVAAILAAGRAGRGRRDLDIGVVLARGGEDRVDQPLRGDRAGQVRARAGAVGVLDLLRGDDVRRAEIVDDVMGQNVELVVRHVEILEIIGGDRQVVGIAVERGGLADEGRVAGSGDGFGDDHFVIVEAVIHHAGDAAQLVADRVAGGEAGEDAAIVVDLDLLGIIVGDAFAARRDGDAAAIIDPGRAGAVRGDDVGLTEFVGVRHRLRRVERDAHAFERFPEVDSVGGGIVAGEAVIIDRLGWREHAVRADQHSGRQCVAVAVHGDERGGNLGDAEAGGAAGEFGDRAAHRHAVADRHAGCGVGEHEHRVGRRGIAVADRRLEIEAVGVDGGDDAGGHHRLANIGRDMAGALDLADRQRDRIVVGDRADRRGIVDHDIAGGRAERHRQSLVGLADEIALHRDDDLLRGLACREADCAREDRTGGEIVCGRGAVEVDAVLDACRIGGAAGAVDREDQVRGAAVALDDPGVADAQMAGAVSGQDGLALVEGAEAVIGSGRPGEVGGARAIALELERKADARRRLFADADIGAGHARRRGARGRSEDTLVRQQLDDGAVGGDQRDTVGSAVLQAVDRIRKGHGAEAIAFIVDDAGQIGGGVDRRGLGRVAAIVEDELVAAEIGTGGAGDLDRLADVGAGIVIVNLVDEHVRGRRGRRGIVVGDRAGGDRVAKRGSALGRAERHGEGLAAFEHRVAADREADFRGGRAGGEADRAAGGEAGAEIARGGTAEAHRPRRRDRAGAAIGARHGEHDVAGAGIAFGDRRIGDAERARLGHGPAKGLADIDAADGVVADRRPVEIGIGRAAADKPERAAHRRRAALGHADIDAGQAGGGAVGRGEHAFIAEELHDHTVRIDERDGVGRAVLHAVDGIGDAAGTEAVLLVRQRAAQRDGVVALAVRPIVEDDFPAGQIGACGAGDLDELAGVGASIVVMDFVDEHVGGHDRSSVCLSVAMPGASDEAARMGNAGTGAWLGCDHDSNIAPLNRLVSGSDILLEYLWIIRQLPRAGRNLPAWTSGNRTLLRTAGPAAGAERPYLRWASLSGRSSRDWTMPARQR